MATEEKVSGKLRRIDHQKAGELADKIGSNRLEVISVWRTIAEQTSERRIRRALAQVRKEHPLPYPRTGRGNRRVSA